MSRTDLSNGPGNWAVVGKGIGQDKQALTPAHNILQQILKNLNPGSNQRGSKKDSFGGGAGGKTSRECAIRGIKVELNLPGFWIWWSLQDSNLRPPQCHCGALPTELRPQSKTNRDSIRFRNAVNPGLVFSRKKCRSIHPNPQSLRTTA